VGDSDITVLFVAALVSVRGGREGGRKGGRDGGREGGKK
jgi:hypothetical protein